MKSILLTTTAIVAFAGAAVAGGHSSVSFSGSAALGHNDDAAGDHDGFYSDINLDVSMSAALDNGITVTASADVDELDAGDQTFAGVTLSIASESASLTYGDTDPSADLHWSGVDGESVPGFNDRDAHIDGDASVRNFDAMLRAEATVGPVTGSLSYGVIANGSTAAQAAGDTLSAMQLAAVADLGVATVVAAYQDEFAGAGSITGVSVAAPVAGFDLMGSYLAQDGGDTSTGVSASYTMGDITVGGYFSMNDIADNAYGLDVSYASGPFSASADIDFVETDGVDPTWEIDTNYDTGMGLIVHAGLVDSGDDYYLAGTYDLGGGASLLASYVEDGGTPNGDDEVGEDDLQIGTTVAVSFSF